MREAIAEPSDSDILAAVRRNFGAVEVYVRRRRGGLECAVRPCNIEFLIAGLQPIKIAEGTRAQLLKQIGA